MMNVVPSALGSTITFTAASSAPTGVQAGTTDANTQAAWYELVNTGTVAVFFAAAATAAAAQAAAVVPTVTAQRVWAVQPGASRIVSDIPDAFWSGALIGASTAVCYVTPVS